MDQYEIKKCDILLYHQNWNTAFWRCTFTTFDNENYYGTISLKKDIWSYTSLRTNFGTYPEHWNDHFCFQLISMIKEKSENRLRLLYKTTVKYKDKHFRPSSYKKPLVITYKKTFS